MLDVLLRGGTVVDGTGAPPVRADVGVRDDTIVLVGGDRHASAREVLDCAGLVIAPGFIDLHSHADFTLRHSPEAASCLFQGVTTLVTGNCGSSPFPAGPGSAGAPIGMRGAADRAERLWPGFAEFADALEHERPGVNVAAMVGHAALRSAIAGAELRELTEPELRQLCALLAEQVEQGVYGLSSGLIYAPGSFAPTAELVALTTEAARAGLLYSTHMRDEGDRLLEALDEAIDTARRAGVRLQVSHLKAMGPANHGKVDEALRRIRAARADGLDVACDVYPYAASSTRLSSRLPNWALDGGPDALVRRLRNAETRARIRAELTAKIGRTVLPDGIVIATLAPGPYQRWVGATLAEIATAHRSEPAETVLDLLAEHRADVWIVNHSMAESDVRTVVADELSAIVSDGWILDVDDGGHPHPRHFGAFARAIAEYHRNQGAVELCNVVRKMTGLPAGRIGLTGRGTLAEGAIADITVFDPATIADQATYQAPLRYASGAVRVLVNGRFAVRDNQLTEHRSGTVIRRPR
jgi:N-acyl-D-amino-acid deacylase